jgi:uncharacterized phage-associated protein
MKTFNYKKTVQALNLFAFLEGGIINHTKAIKLIWLSDRLHLRNHGRTISGDVYFALKNGPVASCSLDLIKGSNLSIIELDYRNSFIKREDSYFIQSLNDFQAKVFSKKELEILNKVYDTYSSMNWSQISEFSHSFPEWKMYEGNLKQNINSRFKIDMNLFFENVDDATNLFINTSEELEVLKDYHKEFHPQYCHS